MQQAIGVTLMSFGEGSRQVALSTEQPTVNVAVRTAGFSTEARRISVNGRTASGNTGVMEGDVVTLMPRVEAG